MTAYEYIQDFYRDQTARRSGVPLIRHIDEGLEILEILNASNITKDAYAIHPIVQSFCESSYPSIIDMDSYALACEYRYFANRFLCCTENDHINTTEQLSKFLHNGMYGQMSMECTQMLIADKMQNRKDFLIYHKGKHSRSEQLDGYFNLWLDFLIPYYGKQEPRY